MNKALVIGSGITGMAAALLLAKQKCFDKITILEAAKFPAPLLTGFSRQGLHFDTGFHCGGGLRSGGILRYWLNALGVWKFIGDENIYSLSEEFHFANNKQTFSFPSVKSELLPSISKQFGNENSHVFSQFLNTIQSVLDASPYTNINCHDLPSLSFENSQSFTNELNKYHLPEELKQMIKARCLLYGLKPEQSTLHDYAMVGGLYFDSCHGIYGGGKSLVKAFMQALKQHDISIVCNSQVDKIIHKNKQFTAVHLSNGQVLDAKTCIFTGHPTQLPKMIGEGIFRPTFYKHVSSLEETDTAFMVFAESNSNYMANKSVYLLPNEHSASLHSTMDAQDPTIYMVGSQQKSDKRLPILIIVPLKEDYFATTCKPRPKEYLAWKQNKATQIKQYIEKRLSNLGPIKIHATATSASMRHWVFGSKGSLYGVAHTISSMPLLPLTRMEGLFLAGQNILLPGILGGIVSAALAVGFTTNHEQVLQDFRNSALTTS